MTLKKKYHQKVKKKKTFRNDSNTPECKKAQDEVKGEIFA